MYGAQYHRECVVVKDDDDAQCRQLVVVVLVLVALRVAPVGHVPLQRYLLAPRHVTAVQPQIDT